MACPARIVVADADPATREMLDMALFGMPGTRVCMLAGLDAVLNACRHRPPEMVVIDSLLLGGEPHPALARLRALPAMSGVVVIVTTEEVAVAQHRALREAGADAVVVKPFDPLTLSRRLCRHWRDAGETRLADATAR